MRRIQSHFFYFAKIKLEIENTYKKGDTDGIKATNLTKFN